MNIKFIEIVVFSLFLLNGIIIPSSKSLNEGKYKFIKIGIEEGLSQSTVMAMLQDKRGYMWFCTANGLNRFDGYEFEIYTKIPGDSSSISDNSISAIFEDSKGFIWIGTSLGNLNRFDPKTETFKHFDIASSSDWYSSKDEKYYNYPISFSRNSNSTITSIAENKNGELWIGTWGKGLIRLNSNTNQKKYFYHLINKPNSISSNRIVKILVDKKSRIWIGTFGGGLSRVDDKKENSFINYNHSIKTKSRIGEKIVSLFADYKNNIWVGSYSNGVSVIKNTDKVSLSKTIQFTNYNIKNSSKLGLNRNDIMSITQDNNGDMWLGTFGGGVFHFFGDKFHNLKAEPSDETSLSENEVLSLYVDKSGVLWVGTQLGSGINKLDISSSKFFSLPINTISNKSLNDNIVWAIHQDKKKNLWVGTYRGGLNRYNSVRNEFTYFKKRENGISDNHIRAVVEDKNENLWIGTYKGGLSFFNRASKSFKHFKFEVDNPNSLSFNQVQSLFIENDTLLWIGTYGGGLNKFSLNDFYKYGSEDFYSFNHNPANPFSISDDRVYTIYKSKKGILWIGTHGGGLNKFNEKENNFISYKHKLNSNSISNDRLMVIHETNNDELLVGTFGGGLDVFNPITEIFTSLKTTLNLECDDVYGILEDGSERFWISSDVGIFKIEKDLKSFTQYDLNDGLQSLEFSGGAYFKSTDGTFYFGGINGLNYFNPDSIVVNDYSPSVVISKIKIFDEVVKGVKEKLVLEKNQNYFSFEFASLDYTNSYKNNYKYMLEGLNDEWIYTDATHRKVNYTNLDPGKYVFKVMGTNSDGVWNTKETNIEIEILTPFWMRWWFIGLILLSLGSIIAFIVYQKIKYLVALDKLKSNLSADLHDNVGAGLTEISILSEIASSEISKPDLATKHLGQISQLSRELVESMSDIVWVVNPQRDSLYDLIVRLKDSYGEILGQMGISLVTLNLEKLKNIKLPIERRQNLYLIFKEALNNSIKHSECTKINIEFTIAGNKLMMSLSDNGRGFDDRKTSLGQGLQNIKKRAKQVNGLVSISSNSENGTIIKYEGPIK
ncbi:MAG: two-component regulator propeller domain-containing protein [Melioribacteraceae bacterium]